MSNQIYTLYACDKYIKLKIYTELETDKWASRGVKDQEEAYRYSVSQKTLGLLK